MSKNKSDNVPATVIATLMAELDSVSKIMREKVKQIEAFKKELNGAKSEAELYELQKIIAKRSQMFDLLRSSIDQHSESTKNVIQQLR